MAFPSCRSTAAASASGTLSTGPGIAVSRWRYSAFTLLGGTLLPEEIVRRTKEAVPSLRPFYFAVYAVLPEAMATKRYVCFLTVRDRKAVLFCDL